MWVTAGKRREMGLGAYPAIGLAAVREREAEARDIVAGGGDPIAERKAAAPVEPTFGEWRGPLHRLDGGILVQRQAPLPVEADADFPLRAALVQARLRPHYR